MRTPSHLLVLVPRRHAGPAGACNGSLTVFAAASTVQVVDERCAPRGMPTKHAQGPRRLRLERRARPPDSRTAAPADVYFSANSAWVDYLVKQTADRDQRNAANAVPQQDRPRRPGLNPAHKSVCRARSTSRTPISAQPLGPNGRLAIGDPQHVPAGIYADRPSAASACGRAFAHRTVRTRECPAGPRACPARRGAARHRLLHRRHSDRPGPHRGDHQRLASCADRIPVRWRPERRTATQHAARLSRLRCEPARSTENSAS